MKEHTTFKIGGNADCFVMPASCKELSAVIKAANMFSVPFFIIGKGSDLLVSDKGIEGAVISLCKLNSISVSENRLICDAGANLSAVCVFALKNSLSGLEFAYGIPGSVGGALYMNAGAYGGEMSDIVVGANALDENGNELYFEKDEMELSYRNSIFAKNGAIITSIVLELNSGDKESINAKMQELIERRKAKQPLDMPSAGSTFKRPAGNFAGTLIEKNGLKGVSIGGATVSEKHAGFIVNSGSATADDVLSLIEKIKETVYSGDKVMLEPEVIFVGRK